MNPILRTVSAAVCALALFAGPAFAADMGGGPTDTVGGSAAVPSVIPETAGSSGVPGSQSVTGANADRGSPMGHSEAELPNNDAGTPINHGPKGVPPNNPNMPPRARTPLVPGASANDADSGTGMNGSIQ